MMKEVKEIQLLRIRLGMHYKNWKAIEKTLKFQNLWSYHVSQQLLD